MDSKNTDISNFERNQPTRTSQKKRRSQRVHKLLQQDIDYCSYLIENYGENYEVYKFLRILMFYIFFIISLK